MIILHELQTPTSSVPPVHCNILVTYYFFSTGVLHNNSISSSSGNNNRIYGICLSDVLSSLTEKHNLGLIGVPLCKELHYDYSHNAPGGVCHMDAPVATVLEIRLL